MNTPSPARRLRHLARQKLDETGALWRQLPPRARLAPNKGWVQAIRESLGMSQADLGRRLGVRASSVGKLEAAERGGTLQLDTLRRAADALGCELVCVLVPRRPLAEMVDDQRLALATPLLARTRHHMQLEAQDVTGSESRLSLLRVAEELISDSQLWRDKP
jgi:predicted DNA-binding mobile mystery protein A